MAKSKSTHLPINDDLSKHSKVRGKPHMSERRSRRLRQLRAIIPAERKKEMKAQIASRAERRASDVARINEDYASSLVALKAERDARKNEVLDQYETDRAAIIEKYEKDYGAKAVAAVL